MRAFSRFLTLGIAAFALGPGAISGCGDRGARVRTETIDRRDLTARVRASGRIRPKHAVDVSSSVMGKIIHLHVAAGDRVRRGQTLVEIDPIAASQRVTQARARARAAEASLALAESRLEEKRAEDDRQNRLFERNLAPESQVIAARTAHVVQQRTVEQLRAELEASRSAIEIAQHDLGQVTISAEMDGVVVRLDVEQGENVVTGTMNTPGTVLMTIADLGTMEAIVLVDETDVVSIRPGLRAEVEVDAFPDTTLTAIVISVGNASARSLPLGSQQSVDYEVVLLIETPFEALRPDLSATAQITVAVREDALSVPIAALTLRTPGQTDGLSPADDDVDGVFAIAGDRAVFRAVSTGIAGDRYFEVTAGLAEGDEIVTGPFETIRRMKDGDRVRRRNAGAER